ncbi:DUF6790 family protein [Pseudonocardia nematodicida]|uniref:DUF6790 family protein n=1 Tax=Pseudonocardia nematodicida TaxID=1206997 RepID=A0ABV1KB57_9PSEU
MIAAVITSVLENFTVTLFVVGLVAAGISIAVHRRERTAATVTGALLDWFLFFSVGVSFAYNAVLHSFFGDFTASVIGWPQSPFQLEVAFASLGFALVGFLAFPRRAHIGVKLAAVLGVTPFLWGAAGGHIYQLVVFGNHAPGNSGAILWSDLLLPAFGLIAVWAHHYTTTRVDPVGRHVRTPADPRESAVN